MMPDETNLDNLDLEFEQLDADLDTLAKNEARFPAPSYGTGVHDQPQSGASDHPDAREQADAVGDEAVGGSSPTPDLDMVDELGAAVGLEMDDQAFLRTNEILEQRDDRRWELDPASAEDYGADS